MGNVFVWGVLILLIPVGGPLPLILYWAYLKFGRNANKTSFTEEDFHSLEKYAVGKAFLLESKYKNFISEEIIAGKNYLCLNIPLKNYKDVTVEAIFFNDFKCVAMNIMSNIRPEFDNEVNSICDYINEKIIRDEYLNPTCKYSYEFVYNNGAVLGHFPTKDTEVQGEMLMIDEAVKAIDRLVYYTDTCLIPMFLKNFANRKIS